MGSVVEFRLEPSSQRFDATDDRWLDQVAILITDLREHAGPVDRRSVPVPGTKGVLDSIVMPIASAGMLTAAVEMLKGWLARDRSRAIKVTWSDSGSVQALELAGSDVDDRAFDEVVRAVTKQLASQ